MPDVRGGDETIDQTDMAFPLSVSRVSGSVSWLFVCRRAVDAGPCVDLEICGDDVLLARSATGLWIALVVIPFVRRSASFSRKHISSMQASGRTSAMPGRKRPSRTSGRLRSAHTLRADSGVPRETECFAHHAVVTHRIAFLRRARRILFLSHGRVEADGDHETLVLSSSSYAAAYDF